MPRVLISRLSSLGDVVCSLPAASAIKAGIPDAHVTWVVSPAFADVVRCCTSVDTVITWKGGKPVEGALDREYDLALDLQGLLKSASVLRTVKAREKLGYHWQREGSALFSSRVLPDPTSVHIVDQYVDVARAAGGEADVAQFNLQPKEPDLAWVTERLQQPYIIINPGAAWASKRWPPKHIAELIDGAGIRAVLIGSRGETSANEVEALCTAEALNLSGQTSISQLVALISMAKAHIGGDTGSTHIAAALGIPAIGLYASTRPERSCPYGQISRCHYSRKGLSTIPPGEVLATLKAAIS